MIEEHNLQWLEERISQFQLKSGRMPQANDFKSNAGLCDYHEAIRIAHLYGLTINDVCANVDCFQCSNPSAKYYDVYKDKYIEIIKLNGVRPDLNSIWKNNLYLPTPRWMIKHCPNKNVKNLEDWYRWVGVSYCHISKEEAVKRIYCMARVKGCPLQYDDFRGKSLTDVPMKILKQYWGTVNAMKKELGLPISRERMDTKYQNIEEIKCNIQKVGLEIAEKEHRKIITGSDFDNCTYSLSACTLGVKTKKYLNCTLSDYVKSLGYDYVQPGHGLNYDYQNGEHTSSRYEYIFSNYLRSIGLKYNVDYFRSVRYDSFVDGYSGKMDCDYVIKYNNRIIYIEIAGVLESFKNWYIDRKPIESQKSKEKYRRNLLVKENLLKQSKVEYFILFPCDLTREFFDSILNDEYLKTKKRLSTHYKNNIEWKNINDDVGIVFDYSNIGRDGQPSVVYSS